MRMRWMADKVGDTLVVRPTKAVGRGLDHATEVVVRRPYRFIKRLLQIIVGLVFLALIVICGTLIALHVLPRGGQGPVPGMQKSGSR